MATLQYIGARYVPLFYENPDTGDMTWKSGVGYEPLTVVKYNDDTYTSKKPVPSTVGDPANNSSYWAKTSDFNAALAALQNQINNIENVKIPQVEEYAGASHNILYYGAIPDDPTFDNIQAFNDCIAANEGSYIYVPSGTYYIKNSIDTYGAADKAVDIIMDKNATIIAADDVDYILNLGHLDEATNHPIGKRKRFVIGGNLVGNEHVTYAVIRICSTYKDADISDVRIEKDSCIGIMVGDDNTKSTDAYIHNVQIIENNRATGVGVQFNAPDNNLSDSRIYYSLHQVEVNAGGISITGIHTLTVPTATKTTAFYLYDSGSVITNCNIDSDDIAFDFARAYAGTCISDCTYGSYSNNTLTAFTIIGSPKINVSNFYMLCNDVATPHIGVEVQRYSGFDWLGTVSEENFHFTNIVIVNAEYMRTGDLLKSFMVQSYKIPTKGALMTSGTWYKLGSAEAPFRGEMNKVEITSNGRFIEFVFGEDYVNSTTYTLDIGVGVAWGSDGASYQIGIVATESSGRLVKEYYLKQVDASYKVVYGVTIDNGTGAKINSDNCKIEALTAMPNTFTPTKIVQASISGGVSVIQ